MRAVWQRVKGAKVVVNEKVVGQIKKGALVFLGVEEGDTERDLKYIVDKCLNLRLFENEEGKFDKSIIDIGGEILLVSQFTLLGDCRKGRRPSFSRAMEPKRANRFYEKAIMMVKELGIRCQGGVFGSHMEVHLVNDGPVTVLLDSKKCL